MNIFLYGVLISCCVTGVINYLIGEQHYNGNVSGNILIGIIGRRMINFKNYQLFKNSSHLINNQKKVNASYAWQPPVAHIFRHLRKTYVLPVKVWLTAYWAWRRK